MAFAFGFEDEGIDVVANDADTERGPLQPAHSISPSDLVGSHG